MNGPTNRLLIGFASYLAGSGVGVFKVTGTYATGELGIRLYDVPQTPDRVITVTPYTIDDSVRTDIKVQGIQVRCRGPARSNALEVTDLDDRIFDLLQAAEHVQLGTVLVDSIERRSSLLLGVDGSGRWETSSNYALTLSRPTLWRTS